MANDILTIKITEDELEGYITIHPSAEDITVEKIKEELLGRKIVYGIDEDAIRRALREKIFGKPILVAKGIPAIDGKDAIIEYKFEKDKKIRLIEDIYGRVDFRELNLIHNVSVGNTLAVKKPATKGRDGITITGKKLKARDGKDIKIPAGKNTKILPDGMRLVATIPGHVVWRDRIDVEPVYTIKGDVDFRTGNIEHVGDITIYNDVKEGFKVKASGNIQIRGNVEKAFVEAEGNIIIENGVVGRDVGIVKAGGNIITKFAENATLQAKGDIIVSNSIFNCNVESEGKVIVCGKEGIILGGKIWAKEEVIANIIGSWTEVLTDIKVGLESKLAKEIVTLSQTLEETKEMLRRLRLDIKTLYKKEAQNGGLSQEKKDLLNQYIHQEGILTEELYDMSKTIAALKKKSYTKSKSKISVNKIAYPGVKIFINKAVMYLRQKYKHVTFKEIAGEIEIVPYTVKKSIDY